MQRGGALAIFWAEVRVAIEKTQIYHCAACEKTFDDPAQATGCCPPTERTSFLCSACEESYEERAEAVDCCFEADGDEVWRCLNCRSTHEDPDDAEACCD